MLSELLLLELVAAGAPASGLKAGKRERQQLKLKPDEASGLKARAAQETFIAVPSNHVP